MASLRFTELQSRPLEFLDFTSLTLDEFQRLVPPFEAAFQARMAAWRLDGKPRTARRFRVYKLTVCPSVASRNPLLYQLLPIIIPYQYVRLRRRKDDASVGTTASGTVA